jgi:chaperonin GroES
MKSGSFKFTPGEYKRVDATGADLKSNIVPLQFSGPSAVLFNLLGLLIDAGRDIASVKDILTGEQQQSNVPATTTLALIEQGLKVFTAIYKRIHRSLGEELGKLFKINRRYLRPEEYFAILDGDPQKVTLADYNEGDYDICPFSDPTISTDAQRLARAQAAVQFVGAPFSNPIEIMRRYYEAIGEENPEALFAPPPSGPSPEQLQKLAELEIKRNESHAKILSMMVDNIAKLAQAESAEVGQQFGLYLEYLKVMREQESNASSGGRSRGLAGQPGNGGGPQVPAGLPGALPAGAGANPGGGVAGLVGPGQVGPDAPQAM